MASDLDTLTQDVTALEASAQAAELRLAQLEADVLAAANASDPAGALALLATRVAAVQSGLDTSVAAAPLPDSTTGTSSVGTTATGVSTTGTDASTGGTDTSLAGSTLASSDPLPSTGG